MESNPTHKEEEKIGEDSCVVCGTFTWKLKIFYIDGLKVCDFGKL